MEEPKNEILFYALCRSCVETLPDDVEMDDYTRISVGRTNKGLQVWCERHNTEVLFVPHQWQDHVECDCCNNKC